MLEVVKVPKDGNDEAEAYNNPQIIDFVEEQEQMKLDSARNS